jgi:choline kinase
VKAFILAAGQARRLYPLTKDIPKTLLRIGDRTILARQVEALRAAGITDITVVVGHHEEKVREALGRTVRYVRNRYFAATADILSLWSVRAQMTGPFVYLHGDVLFAAEILTRLLDDKPADVRLAVEAKACDDEDEKVRVVGDLVVEIGKAIPLPDAYGEFIGLARVSATAAPLLRAALEAVVDEGELEAQCVTSVQRLIDRGVQVRMTAVAGLPWREVDYPEDFDAAVKQQALFA